MIEEASEAEERNRETRKLQQQDQNRVNQIK